MGGERLLSICELSRCEYKDAGAAVQSADVSDLLLTRLTARDLDGIGRAAVLASRPPWQEPFQHPRTSPSETFQGRTAFPSLPVRKLARFVINNVSLLQNIMDSSLSKGRW